jgi:hypothetical protein
MSTLIISRIRTAPAYSNRLFKYINDLKTGSRFLENGRFLLYNCSHHCQIEYFISLPVFMMTLQLNLLHVAEFLLDE